MVVIEYSATKTMPETAETVPKRVGLPWFSTWVVVVSVSAVASSLLVMAVHGRHGFFAGALATTVCLLAALFDAFTARIPNTITYVATMIGVAVNAAATIMGLLHAERAATWLGAAGIEQSLWALAVCVPLAVIGMWFRVGGGDLKLLVAVGAILGLLELGSAKIKFTATVPVSRPASNRRITSLICPPPSSPAR